MADSRCVFLWMILALSIPWNVMSLDDTYEDMMRNAFSVPTKDEIRQANQFLRKEMQFMFRKGKVGSVSSNTFYDIVNPSSEKINKNISSGLLKSDDSPSLFAASDICLNHTGILTEALQNEEEWALRVIDASGKIGSGILDGNFKWYGSFDECLAARGYYLDQEIFKGKYCTANVPISLIGRSASVGICLPDSCEARDMRDIINDALASIGSTTKVGVSCKVYEKELDDLAIGAIVTCSFILGCMVIGTLYDIISVQMTRWQTDVLSEKTPILDEKPRSQANREKGTLAKVLLAFSVYTNGKKMLGTDQPPGALTAVNGMRFLSMAWVILGHSFSSMNSVSVNGAVFLPKMLDNWTFQAICNAFVSVDSFFTMSGLLLSYLFMKEMESKGKINWLMFYFHRFWRLTPPYMLVLFVHVALDRYFADGPIWPADTGFEKDFCKESWWTNLLYVNNLVKLDNRCMGWSWYLANDMQFFVISPLLLVPLYYSPIIGTVINALCLLGTIIASGVISAHHELNASHYTPGYNGKVYWDEYYVPPYTRIGPYIVGVYVGYLLYRTGKDFKMSKILNIIGWLVAAAAACLVLYGLTDAVRNQEKLDVDLAAFYNAVHRSVWGACVCWVIFTCARGYGGFVNTILSWKAFVPLGRLSYVAYLIHPIIINVAYRSTRTGLYITEISAVYLFLGHMVTSYAISYVVSLAFESPMMGLEKALLHRKK